MRKREIRTILQAFGLLTQLGFTVVVAVGMGVGLGVSLGRALGWPGTGLLLGVVSGLGGALVGARGLVGQLLTPESFVEEGACPSRSPSPPPRATPETASRS